jgi:DnaK suppressor protein
VVKGIRGEKMNETELKNLKHFLKNQKSSLLNKYMEFKSFNASSGEHISEEAEIAARDQTSSVQHRLHERERRMLLLIEKALSKIESGTYGQCDYCESSIGVKRLRARPFANLCIECMEEQEESKSLFI